WRRILDSVDCEGVDFRIARAVSYAHIGDTPILQDLELDIHFAVFIWGDLSRAGCVVVPGAAAVGQDSTSAIRGEGDAMGVANELHDADLLEGVCCGSIRVRAVVCDCFGTALARGCCGKRNQNGCKKSPNSKMLAGAMWHMSLLVTGTSKSR